MTKVAIITTHHEPNYGNKLQNYALQTILQRLGYDVETINDARSWPDLTSWRVNKKALLHFFIRFRTQPWHVKYSKFFLWSKMHINYSKVNIHTDADMVGLAEKYDFFVVGSDQIWNPEWRIFSNEFGFANFARREQKVAYAPSLGVSIMPPERIEEYKKWLKDWNALSCREEEGAKIISELTSKDVPVVLDPTMLFTQEDWNKITSHRIVKDKYILVYSVIGMREEYRTHIEKLASDLHLKVINLSEGKYLNSGPSEFISLVKYASYIVTDSFHGSVFAILYHVPLIVINRTLITGERDKTSRLKTLFRIIGMEEIEFNDLFNEILNLNWAEADRRLEIARSQSINYLTNALRKNE